MHTIPQIQAWQHNNINLGLSVGINKLTVRNVTTKNNLVGYTNFLGESFEVLPEFTVTSKLYTHWLLGLQDR